MARPKSLSTKGEFNVIQVSAGFWELRFRDVVIYSSSNRSWLYRKRKIYSSWYSVIVDLIQTSRK